MYEQHFGLKRRPFRANATGSDVFVGPQFATAMAGIKQAMSVSDAVATVSGPVGSGKTTLVLKALDSISSDARVILIGRMRMHSGDVLEYLLEQLGVENQNGGAIQKFGRFRRRLKELDESNSRVYLVIEDSAHLDTDTLAEIEALTAADAGASEGAAIILMGDEQLEDLLTNSNHNRLQQRTRQRFKTTPLCAAELRGYLRHCFRLAGGDFEEHFDANAAPLLHHLSGGVPRIANNLVDAVMTAAADQGESKVSSQLLARIAENQFGLSVAGFDLIEKQLEEPAALETPPVIAEPEPKPAKEEPVIVFSEESVAEELPELIHDTLPDLQVLAPELATEKVAHPESPAELPLEPSPIPSDEADGTAEPPSDIPQLDVIDDQLPAWDRDPTLAQLRPDLDALEQAMAFAHADDPIPAVTSGKAPTSNDDAIEADAIPEITLDHAISQRIEYHLIDEPGEISAPEAADAVAPATTPNPEVAKPPAKKADAEIDKIAAELAKAKSLEDVDDRMAETLFGNDLTLAASQFITKPEIAEPANDNLDTEVTPEPPVPVVEPVPESVDEPVPEPVDEPAAEPEAKELTLEAPATPDEGGVDLSASQRLKTVRALNADIHPPLREPEAPTANGRSADNPAETESIEDQINTSMTQTLKALNVNPPVSHDDFDEDEQEGKSGFFARFKRS